MSIVTSPARALLWLALAFPCAQACAQAGGFSTPAADPQAAVPATVYEPAVRYRAAPPPAATPDRNWLASNAAVAGSNPMAGHAAHAAAGGHDHHAGMAMPADPQAGKPGDKPAAAPAPQQCTPAAGGKDGKGCCTGTGAGGTGHEHHAGMDMSGASGGCTCCAGKSGAVS